MRTEYDGYLIVLHVDPEGRLRVLFPLDPDKDNFIRGDKKYEVRGRGGRESFEVDGTGRGAVYAAVSRDPFRFDGFTIADHWDYRALAPARLQEDPEPELNDLVRRMAQGNFDYDVLSYEVMSTIRIRVVVLSIAILWLGVRRRLVRLLLRLPLLRPFAVQSFHRLLLWPSLPALLLRSVLLRLRSILQSRSSTIHTTTRRRTTPGMHIPAGTTATTIRITTAGIAPTTGRTLLIVSGDPTGFTARLSQPGRNDIRRSVNTVYHPTQLTGTPARYLHAGAPGD